MSYLIGAVYITVAVATARYFYVLGFEADYKESTDKHGIADEEWKLKQAKLFGSRMALLGVLWPIALPLWIILLIIFRLTPTEKLIEKRKKEEELKARIEAEVRKLRAEYFDLGLLIPDDDTLQKIAEDRIHNGH